VDLLDMESFDERPMLGVMDTNPLAMHKVSLSFPEFERSQ